MYFGFSCMFFIGSQEFKTWDQAEITVHLQSLQTVESGCQQAKMVFPNPSRRFLTAVHFISAEFPQQLHRFLWISHGFCRIPVIPVPMQTHSVDLLSGAPKKTTDKLQHVLNAAARVVSNRNKYNRGLTQFQCPTLPWLDVTDRIWFSLCIQMYKCQHSMTAGYLAELWKPVANIDGHQHLRSARRSSSQIVNIRRMRILLCWTFSLACCSWLLINSALSLCLLLDVSLNISTSHITSTLSAFEVCYT